MNHEYLKRFFLLDVVSVPAVSVDQARRDMEKGFFLKGEFAFVPMAVNEDPCSLQCARIGGWGVIEMRETVEHLEARKSQIKEPDDIFNSTFSILDEPVVIHNSDAVVLLELPGDLSLVSVDDSIFARRGSDYFRVSPLLKDSQHLSFMQLIYDLVFRNGLLLSAHALEKRLDVLISDFMESTPVLVSRVSKKEVIH